MKKLLSIFSVILLTSAISVSTTACVKPLSKKHNLKDDLNNIDLGVVDEKNPGQKPTYDELLETLHNKNLSLDINKISLSNEKVDKVDVTGDGIFYTKDIITVNFKETTLNINTLIVKGTDLGKIATTGKVSSDQIKNAISSQIPSVDISHIIVDVNDNKNATVTGDDIVYNGTVNVIFTTDNSVALNTIIDSKKPLAIATFGKDVPTPKQISTKLKTMYADLDTNVLDITNITETSAIIASTDQTKYTGTVTVTLQLDKTIDLNTIINNGLPKVAITGNQITTNDVMKALQKQYPTLNVNAISVTLSNDNKTATVVSTDKKIYTGADVIINNLLIDLNSVLATTLPQFTIPGKTSPTLEQVKSAISKANRNLVITNVTIGTPSSTNVIVTGDGNLYSKDAITINYTCDTTVDLSSVFTKRDLDVINTNGLSRPVVEQVKSAISKANPDLNMKAIKFDDSDITTNQVVVTGDNATYRGTVSANFTVDNSTISVSGFNYDHTETNIAFSLKTDWTGPDQVILDNWTNYAPDWNSFTTKFSKLSFGNDALFGIFCNNYTDQKLTGSQLDVATNKISEDRNVNMFQEDYSYQGGVWHGNVELHGQLHIWHDVTKVYVNYTGNADTMWCARDRVLNVKLYSATFSK